MKATDTNGALGAPQPATQWEALKARAMRLTGMDEMAYAELVFEQGLQYLGSYWQHRVNAAQIFGHSRRYWLWWRNLWARQDELLLPMLEEILEDSINEGRYVDVWQLRDTYTDEHSGAKLATRKWPHSKWERWLTEETGNESDNLNPQAK